MRRVLAGTAVCSVALTASAAAAAFTGATVPRQTDNVNKHGVTGVTVGCPGAASGSCTGKLTLKTAGKVKQGSTSRVLTLGSHDFSIAAGQKGAVTVKLSSQGARLVKSSGTVKANAIATSHDASGHDATNKTQIKLKKRHKPKCTPVQYICT